jgi:hypothetical protein
MSDATLMNRVQQMLNRLLDRGTEAEGGATGDLLSAVWSFLRHPRVLEDRAMEIEERLAVLERTIVEDLKAAIEKRIVAAEESGAAVEHRLEEDLAHAVSKRVASVEGRLQAVRARVVGELKAELRRAIPIVVLGAGALVLALVGAIYALVGAWLALKGLLGAVSASFALAVAFFFLSVVVLTILSTVRRRPRPPPASV